MFSVRSDGEEKKEWRGSRGEEGAWDGGWDGIWCLKFCVCVCDSICTKRWDVCSRVKVNGVFEPTFVSLCLFVCKSVSVCVNVRVRERVSGDAPSKSSPRQGVIHDFITQALHKALSNTPPFLSTPLCFFPMLPFLFSCLSCSFLHTAFSLPSLLFYNSPLLNALPYILLSLICGFTPLLPLSPPDLPLFFIVFFPSCSRVLCLNVFFWGGCLFCNLSSLLFSSLLFSV